MEVGLLPMLIMLGLEGALLFFLFESLLNPEGDK